MTQGSTAGNLKMTAFNFCLPPPGILFHPLSFLVKAPSSAQSVSTWPAAALVVSNMIGTGVFMSLGFQISGFSHPDGTSDLTGSVFPLIMLWIVGGTLALCGALCYAELATALPRSGGEYNFLSRIYHPGVGFCTGLCSATVGFAAPAAASALVFGHYFSRAFPALALHLPGDPERDLAFLIVTLATLAHLRSLRFTGFFQAATTSVTVLLILTFVVCGFGRTAPQPVTFLPHAADWPLLVSVAFGSSLIWVMYAYSGWNAAAYIVEEIRDPSRTLPRALILGTLFVMVLYVAINSVFLYTTPLSVLAGQPEVAHVAGQQIFGEAGARLGSALICVGLIANVSSMVWVGSRIAQAMGNTYPRLSLAARATATRVPYVAILFQYAIIVVLLCFDPKTIMNYIESILIFWSLLAVLGVIVLRLREPGLLRPYKTWGYPLPPLVFATIGIFCLVQTCQSAPMETIIGTLTVLVGIPIYLFVARRVPARDLPGESVPENP